MSKFAAINSAVAEYIDLPVKCPDGRMRTFRVYSPPARVALAGEELLELAEKHGKEDALEAFTGAVADAVSVEGDQSDTAEAPNLRSVLNDDDPRSLNQRLLGKAWDKMIDADVSGAVLAHAAFTTIVWCAYGEDNAVKYWVEGIKGPKVATPTDRQDQSKKGKRKKGNPANR